MFWKPSGLGPCTLSFIIVSPRHTGHICRVILYQYGPTRLSIFIAIVVPRVVGVQLIELPWFYAVMSLSFFYFVQADGACIVVCEVPERPFAFILH